MGRLKQLVDYDWAGANASFQRAIALEPGNHEAIRMAAESTAELGRSDEARLARRNRAHTLRYLSCVSVCAYVLRAWPRKAVGRRIAGGNCEIARK